MKRITRTHAALRAAALTLALALALSGCGASSASTSAIASYTTEASGATTDTAAEVTAADVNFSAVDYAATAFTDRKIIRDASLSMETLDFDATVAALLSAVQQAGGYVAEANLRTPTAETDTRRATYTLRIPAAQYDAFLAGAGEAGTVLHKTETTEDITSDYVDVEARLKSLRLQEERLYAMMEQAGELETLLAIQNQLTEVQYRIESYTSTQRTYNDLVDYSTITVTLNEVRRATSNPTTFGQQLTTAFADGLYTFVSVLGSLLLAVAAALPFLLVGLLIFVCAWRLYKHNRKGNLHKKSADTQPPAPHDAQAHTPAAQTETMPDEPMK